MTDITVWINIKILPGNTGPAQVQIHIDRQYPNDLSVILPDGRSVIIARRDLAIVAKFLEALL